MEIRAATWDMVEETSACATMRLRVGKLNPVRRAVCFTMHFLTLQTTVRYLGWYSELHQEFNPLEETSKLLHLVGLSDYNEALASLDPSSYTIVLHIETFENESLCE